MVVKKRFLLKLSGGAMRDIDSSENYSNRKIDDLARQIAFLRRSYYLGIVLGGGNIWRGARNLHVLDRKTSDYLGMIATMMNGVVLQSALLKFDLKADIFSAVEINRISRVINPFEVEFAIKKDMGILIFVGGTGMPFFSTDTAAVVRAIEIGADTILMGKDGVDGVYSADPKLDENAIFYEQISYNEVIERELKVIDGTAIMLAKEHGIKLVIFDQTKEDAFIKAADLTIKHTLVI